MTVQRLEHIGVVVDDLAAATAFFVALGLEVEGEASVEGGLVDRVNGLEGVQADVVILQYPGRRQPARAGQVPLARVRRRRRAGAAQRPGHPPHPVRRRRRRGVPRRACERRAASWSASWSNYEDSYRLCYVRGPAGIIVELAEKIG